MMINHKNMNILTLFIFLIFAIIFFVIGCYEIVFTIHEYSELVVIPSIVEAVVDLILTAAFFLVPVFLMLSLIPLKICEDKGTRKLYCKTILGTLKLELNTKKPIWSLYDDSDQSWAILFFCRGRFIFFNNSNFPNLRHILFKNIS